MVKRAVQKHAKIFRYPLGLENEETMAVTSVCNPRIRQNKNVRYTKGKVEQLVHLG